VRAPVNQAVPAAVVQWCRRVPDRAGEARGRPPHRRDFRASDAESQYL